MPLLPSGRVDLGMQPGLGARRPIEAKKSKADATAGVRSLLADGW